MNLVKAKYMFFVSFWQLFGRFKFFQNKKLKKLN